MTMLDYDSLPPPIRGWLAQQPNDYDARTVLGYWRIWRGSVGQFLDMLEKEEA